MTFELAVMEEKVKPHQVTALHLLSGFVIGGTGACFYLLYNNMKWVALAMMAVGLALLLLSLFRNMWMTGAGVNKVFRIGELVILLCAAGYLALQHKWLPTAVPGSLAAAILFALYWENEAAPGLSILVNTEGIKLPVTSRKRFVHWHEVEQVLLRYGILTIDCHNNRFFQFNVDPMGIDKDQFENYCMTNVNANIDKREQEW